MRAGEPLSQHSAESGLYRTSCSSSIEEQ